MPNGKDRTSIGGVPMVTELRERVTVVAGKLEALRRHL